MIDKKLEALLNEEIDGVTTSEASARLKRILDSDPEARGAYQGLQRVSELLARVPLETPPPELKENILRGIEPLARNRAVAVETHRGEGWLSGLFRPFRGLNPAYGLSFAGGAVLTVAVFLLVNQAPRLNPDSLTATMSPPRAYQAMETVDLKPFSIPGAEGTLETRISAESAVARIEIHAAGGADLSVHFDPGSVRPRGVQVAEAPLGDISMGADEIRIVHQGRNVYWIAFDPAGNGPGALRVHISTREGVLEESLATGF